jgi:Protein of unknown function (DUF2946)
MRIGIAQHSLSHLRRPWAVWLALCIAVCMAIAPTLSHAFAFAQGATNSVEICTPTGPRIVALQSDTSADSSPGQESARTLDHCPLCLHAPGHAAPPAHPQPYFIQLDDGVLAHTPSPTHFVPFASYSRASPRGPPALS